MPRLSDNLTPSQLINNHPLARRKIATTFTSWWFLNMLRLCLRCRRCERKKLSLSRGTRSTHTYLSKYSDRNNYLDIHRNILHNRITPHPLTRRNITTTFTSNYLLLAQSVSVHNWPLTPKPDYSESIIAISILHANQRPTLCDCGVAMVCSMKARYYKYLQI